MTDIRTRHPPKKHGNGWTDPVAFKKNTDGHGLHLGIPWPPLHHTINGAYATVETFGLLDSS